jgi:hypothetical protein
MLLRRQHKCLSDRAGPFGGRAPLYYFFAALWTKNYFAAVTATLFFIGHTVSNAINHLL